MGQTIENVTAVRYENPISNRNALLRPNTGMLTNITPITDRNLPLAWEDKQLATDR
jgi:hypothetical protein